MEGDMRDKRDVGPGIVPHRTQGKWSGGQTVLA